MFQSQEKSSKSRKKKATKSTNVCKIEKDWNEHADLLQLVAIMLL